MHGQIKLLDGLRRWYDDNKEPLWLIAVLVSGWVVAALVWIY
jgi:hypothetical protein